MSLRQLMNQEQLQQFILRQLGAPQIKVELTQEDLDIAVEEARRWFSAKKGVKRATAMQAFSGQVEYELPEDVDVVLDVAFSTTNDLSRLVDPMNLYGGQVPYDIFPGFSAGNRLSGYLQTIQYLEVAKRILGGEVEWRQDGRRLFIFPTPKTSGTVMVDYKSITVTIEQLSERDHDLVKRFAWAWGMRKLADVYSKYGSMPTAQGQTSLDGERLSQRSDAMFEQLQEEISQSGFPMGFLTG